MLQALFPRISLYTYYRQRLLRRILAITGLGFLIPVWILKPSTATWIVSGFVVFCWLVSELVLSPTKVIPPLDNPPALTGKDAMLPEDTQVLGVILEGRAHAWPMGILIPHHIINETVHGTPVTAAYCPACRSGYVFDPVVDGQRLTFEPVSVHRRNMIMRDRETGTIWQHETGEALMGKYRGKTLDLLGGALQLEGLANGTSRDHRLRATGRVSAPLSPGSGLRTAFGSWSETHGQPWAIWAGPALGSTCLYRWDHARRSSQSLSNAGLARLPDHKRSSRQPIDCDFL